LVNFEIVPAHLRYAKAVPGSQSVAPTWDPTKTRSPAFVTAIDEQLHAETYPEDRYLAYNGCVMKCR
jgi:hypothetical protein